MILSPVHRRRWLHLARLVEKSRRYDQRKVTHNCGTPGCLMGHAIAYRARVEKKDVKQLTWDATLRWLGIPRGEWMAHLVASWGCNDARRSGKKAAAYVREWLRSQLTTP